MGYIVDLAQSEWEYPAPACRVKEHRAHVVGDVARLILFECDVPRADAAEAGGP